MTRRRAWRRRLERNGVVLITTELAVLAPIATATTPTELLLGVLAVLAPAAGGVYVTEQAFARSELERAERHRAAGPALKAIAAKARAILIESYLSTELNSGAAAGGMPSGPIITYTVGSLVASVRAGEIPHGHMLWQRMADGIRGRAEEFGASTGAFAVDLPEEGRVATRELLDLAGAAADGAEAVDQAWVLETSARWQGDGSEHRRAKDKLAAAEARFAGALLPLDDRVIALERVAASW